MSHSPRLKYGILYFKNLTLLKLQPIPHWAWILLQSFAKPSVL